MVMFRGEERGMSGVALGGSGCSGNGARLGD